MTRVATYLGIAVKIVFVNAGHHRDHFARLLLFTFFIRRIVPVPIFVYVTVIAAHAKGGRHEIHYWYQL